MTTAKYRPYDAKRNALAATGPDLDLLLDADDYYQDVLETLKHVDGPKLFLTAWVLAPEIALAAATGFVEMLTDTLNKPNSACYVLWNTKAATKTPQQLLDLAKQLQADVKAGLTNKADIGHLKIIFSGNFDYGVEGFEKRILGEFIPWWAPTPKDAKEFVHQLFLRDLPSDTKTFGNLTKPSIASHHQKTLTIVGTAAGKSALVAYCGGLDFFTGPAGIEGSVCHGGNDWHDAQMRARGRLGRDVLANFVERWNFELGRFDKIVQFGVTKTDTLDADALFAKTDHPLAANVITERSMTGEPSSATEIKSRYLDLIGQATLRIFVENQYFRHQEVAKKIVKRLGDAPNLLVSIIVPSYSEEVQRADLPALRRQYARASDQATRDSLMKQVEAKSLTIDPLAKLQLLMQVRVFEQLFPQDASGKVTGDHPKVRIWFPERASKGSTPTVSVLPYIHTKLMLVDLRGLTVGSANVNPRSLDGDVDTEINITVTDADTIKKLLPFDPFNWPEDENATGQIPYAGSYFAKHNLIRYHFRHLEVDRVYARFPKGRAALLDYLDGLKASMTKVNIRLTRAQLKAKLDAVQAKIDIDNMDLGDKFLEIAEPLF